MNSKVYIAAVLLGIACAASATYHFKSKSFDTCDMIATVTTYSQDTSFYNKTTIASHGIYIMVNDSYCPNNQSECELNSIYLFRHDLSLFDDEVLRFIYTIKHGFGCDCSKKYVPLGSLPDPHRPIEEWFKNREPAVFHNIKCFQFYNNTDAIFYADDTTGDFYGMKINGYELLYEFSAASFVPSDFTFSKDRGNLCLDLDPKTGDDPLATDWKDTCKNYSSCN